MYHRYYELEDTLTEPDDEVLVYPDEDDLDNDDYEPDVADLNDLRIAA